MGSSRYTPPSIVPKSPVSTGVKTALRPYLFRSRLPEGALGYVYVLCPKGKEDLLFDAVRNHELPNFAVVVAAVAGEPDEQTRHNMERYYGFNHTELVETLVYDVSEASVA